MITLGQYLRPSKNHLPVKRFVTPEEFEEHLKLYGVEITRSGKDYSYLHPHKQKPIRGKRLGENYSKEAIE